MSSATVEGRAWGRSLGAVMAGAAVGIVLSVGTDLAMQVLGLFPAISQAMSDSRLLLATAYRTLYGVMAGYVTAWLAPRLPMQHALAGGTLGFAVSAIGAAATWNRGLGPHWYPLALVVLALPQAWAGGKLRLLQQARGE